MEMVANLISKKQRNYRSGGTNVTVAARLSFLSSVPYYILGLPLFDRTCIPVNQSGKQHYILKISRKRADQQP